MLYRATQFASRTWSIPVEDLDLSIEPIAGGLESRVIRATFRAPRSKGARPDSFVVKELRGPQRRETEIYRQLWTLSDSPPTVRLLGIEATENADYLYLEEATQQCAWPWRQTAASAAVCRALARLHESELRSKRLIDWDYELNSRSLRVKHWLWQLMRVTRRVCVTGAEWAISAGLSPPCRS